MCMSEGVYGCMYWSRSELMTTHHNNSFYLCYEKKETNKGLQDIWVKDIWVLDTWVLDTWVLGHMGTRT